MKKTEDEKPLWIREFEHGMTEDWKDNSDFLFAECDGCKRAIISSNAEGDIEWRHYAHPDFHKPDIPAICFNPQPNLSTIIGTQKKVEEPKGIFQKKLDKQPESAEMLLFMLSAQDRFLFVELVKRNQKSFTPGEVSLAKRMLLALKSDYVLNVEVNNPGGVPEEDK